DWIDVLEGGIADERKHYRTQPDGNRPRECFLIALSGQLSARHARHDLLDVHQKRPGPLRWQADLKRVGEVHARSCWVVSDAVPRMCQTPRATCNRCESPYRGPTS